MWVFYALILCSRQPQKFVFRVTRTDNYFFYFVFVFRVDPVRN